MVNKVQNISARDLDRVAKLVGVYVVIVVATVAALAILSASDSDQATTEAWWHAVIVGVFAVVLPVRLRAARQGSSRAVVAVGIIATVLVVVNVVEALIPGFLPTWMRIEMLVVAALMATVSVTILRRRS